MNLQIKLSPLKLQFLLRRIKNLNQTIEDQNHLLQTHFTAATCNFDHLSNKLQNIKPEIPLQEEDKEHEDFYNPTKPETKGETINLFEKRDENRDIFNTSVVSERDEEESIIVREERDDFSSPVSDSSIYNRVEKETDITEDKVQEKFSNSSRAEGEEVIDVDQSELGTTFKVLPEKINEKKQELKETVHSELHSEKHESGTDEVYEPNWKQLYINGLENREKILLTEYTSNLRNFKEVKKKLDQVEKNNKDSLFKSSMEIKQLKNDNTFKDEELRSLRLKLSSLQSHPDLDKSLKKGNPPISSISSLNSNQKPLYVLLNDRYFEASSKTESTAQTITASNTENFHGSSIEEKFRAAIDDLLEENLEFWLRFSTSFHQIQKFQTSIQDLQSELSKLKEKQEGSGNETLKSDIRPIYRHLREIHTELKLWFKHNALLKDELKTRLSSLCIIEEELLLLSSSRASREEMSELSHFQAAKFQGEVQNMKQENHKVADELKAGLNQVNGLRVEIERTLSKMDEDFGFSEPNNSGKTSLSRSRIPLRSFLFGVRLKKQKQTSIFACINPTLQKQYSDLASGHSP